ncbi:hypothetical protein D3C80_1685790 [compost metagenome]
MYNVAVSGRTTLNHLAAALKDSLSSNNIFYTKDIIYRDFRVGDVRHSQADISKAKRLLGYSPEYDVLSGIDKAMPWYLAFLA